MIPRVAEKIGARCGFVSVTLSERSSACQGNASDEDMTNEVVLTSYIFDYESAERMCNEDYGTVLLNKSKFELLP